MDKILYDASFREMPNSEGESRVSQSELGECPECVGCTGQSVRIWVLVPALRAGSTTRASMPSTTL